jgi:hypothetical protein
VTETNVGVLGYSEVAELGRLYRSNTSLLFDIYPLSRKPFRIRHEASEKTTESERRKGAYVIHHVEQAIAVYSTLRDHLVIDKEEACSDPVRSLVPLVMAGTRLCKSDPEGPVDYCTVEVHWRVTFDLAGRSDCMAGKYLLLGLVMLFDLVAQIRLSVYWGVEVEKAVDPLSLECAYPR